MGQELTGSLGSWVTLSDPFPALHQGERRARSKIGVQRIQDSGIHKHVYSATSRPICIKFGLHTRVTGAKNYTCQNSRWRGRHLGFGFLCHILVANEDICVNFGTQIDIVTVVCGT